MSELDERTAPVYVSELRREASRWRNRVRVLESYIKSMGVDPSSIISGSERAQRLPFPAHPPQQR